MVPTLQWLFPPFRLDPENACLWRDTERLPLRPKTLAVLQHLVQHAGQVVHKTTLLETIWPDTSVGDGVLKNCLGELRHLLGDTALAEAYADTGQSATALALLAEARTVAQQAGGRYWEAELHRRTGVLLLRQATPDLTQAVTSLTHALTLARRQHLHTWELRAALSLARLRQQQGQGVAALDLLHAVLHEYPDTSETVERQEALAYLTALQSHVLAIHVGAPTETRDP